MKDTIRQAEACRRKAHEVRKIAHGAHNAHEREAFQRLADGYDVLADQLEKMAKRPSDRGDQITWH